MRSIFLVSALLVLGLGCSDDPDPASNNATTNNQTTTNNDTSTNNSTVNVDNTGITYQSSYQLIFDSLAFDKGTAAFPLNGILTSNLDQTLDYPIVVLVDIRNIDTEAGTAEIRGGAGLKTDTAGEYIWDPDGDDRYDEGSLVATTGRFEGVLQQLDFVATLVTETETQKVPIPIQGLEFVANLELSQDGKTATIKNGTIAGYLTKTDGDLAQVQLIPGNDPVPITALFKTSNLNFNSTTKEIVEKATGDSWWLTGSFTAAPTKVVE